MLDTKTPIKNLQTALAQDLVKLEVSEINEDHLQMIVDVYTQVYDTLNLVSKE